MILENKSKGIGLNVHNSYPTTCVNSLVQKDFQSHTTVVSKEPILANFFNYFEEMYAIFNQNGFDPFIEEYYDSWLHR